MNKSHETDRKTSLRTIANAVKRNAGATALTLTLAALAPAAAQAEKGPVEKKLSRHVPMSLIGQRATSDMINHRDLVAFNGVLITKQAHANGGTEATPTPTGGITYPAATVTISGEGVEYPVLLFRGDPKSKSGHDNFTNGDYAFGQLVTGKQPHIKPIKFDPNTMELTPWTMEGSNGPLLASFIFPKNPANGSLDLRNPVTGSGNLLLKGGPLDNANGESWQIGHPIEGKG